MKHRISPAAAIATVALFFSLGGAGMAATGYRITSLWQISPKVRHALRGHAGAQGVRGPAGPQGVAGPQGAPADLGAVIDWRNNFHWSAMTTLDPDSPEATATVHCANGQQALTGGFHGDNGVIVTRSEPILAPLPPDATSSTPQPAIGWSATAELASGRKGQTFFAWVECVKQS